MELFNLITIPPDPPAGGIAARDFTISNGQIFTPGFAVLNAPQPKTPLGGDTLHISLDVTANGQLPLPPLEADSPSQIFNITVFLYSYATGRNFTVSNGTTAGEDDASLGNIMEQEPGSTVKHINWAWPDCLVGDGQREGDESDRGAYNISIRQNFRLNGEDHYTIFDVPISVTNRIEESDDRPSCDVLTNELLSPEDIDAESANAVGVLFTPDDATEVDFEEGGGDDGEDDGNNGDDDGDSDNGNDGTDNDNGDGNGNNDNGGGNNGNNGNGGANNGDSNAGDDNGAADNGGDNADDPPFGGQREEATPEDGLGAGATLGFSWTLLLAGALFTMY